MSYSMNIVSKKIALLKRWYLMLIGKSNVAVEQDEGKAYRVGEIGGGYYNDLTGKISKGTLLDKRGIPLTIIGNGEKVYFPIAIFQYGLGCYDLYMLKNDEKAFKDFINIVKWAFDHINDDGSWKCFDLLGSEKYSVSSMCQGEGASLLYRGYWQTNCEKYRFAAEKAIDFMLMDYDLGGTAIYEGNDMYLEEFPQKNRKTVLNGWIFSLFGLYDASLVAPEKYSLKFKHAIDTLKNELYLYDNGYWSWYDLEHKITSPAYHKLHIAQLKILYTLTNEIIFFEMAKKFEGYINKKTNIVKAVLIKIYQKLLENPDIVAIK